MEKIVELTGKEFLEKRFEAAKEILPMLLNKNDLEYIVDSRKRTSLIFHAVKIADNLLAEVGYTFKGSENQIQNNEDLTAIRKLSDLLHGEDSSEDEE